jgi:hypothetical protein
VKERNLIVVNNDYYIKLCTTYEIKADTDFHYFKRAGTNLPLQKLADITSGLLTVASPQFYK